MGIYKVKDRRGRRRYVVSKYWPNGSGRLRKYAPNYRSAQALQTRVESSILDGTWKQLKQELAGQNRTIWTVRSFYERFFEEYCKPRLRCLRRYALSFKSLNAVLGNIPLKASRFSGSLVDLHSREPLPRFHDFRNWLGAKRTKQHMDMVGHHYERKQLVAFTVEVTKSVSHHIRQNRILQHPGAASLVQPVFDSS
jgi:hypothetical protein